MDVARVVLSVARVYAAGLVVLGVLTVVWLLVPGLEQSPYVSGLWFALGGFGLLVGLTFVLVQLSR
jgi:hypothetical protein